MSLKSLARNVRSQESSTTEFMRVSEELRHLQFSDIPPDVLLVCRVVLAVWRSCCSHAMIGWSAGVPAGVHCSRRTPRGRGLCVCARCGRRPCVRARGERCRSCARVAPQITYAQLKKIFKCAVRALGAAVQCAARVAALRCALLAAQRR